ncbi:MAG: lamin tail domain-containing protein, partial [Ekhidna sp.]
MRRLLFIYLFVQASVSFAQITENFEDETLGNSPTLFTPSWVGDVSQFILVDEAGDKQLRSAAGDLSSSLEYAISTPSTSIYEASWEFFVNLKFGTSGSNYVDFFLVSENSDLSETQNGYFIRIGDTEDWIALHKIEDGVSSANSTPLISTATGLVNSSSSNPFRIRVIRNASGLWELFVDEDDTGSFVSAGTVSDASIESSSHLGILILQSGAASPADNHFFNDFVVTGGVVPDSAPPTIQSVTAISSTEVDVLFSEDVNQAIAETITNYSIDGSVTVSNAAIDGDNSALVHLTTSALTNGDSYTITVNNVEDENGNAISANSESSFEYLVVEEAEAEDVVVNEFYAAPSEDSNIPNEEFIELLNVSDKFIQMENWTFSDESGTSSAFGSFILKPDAYVILTNTGNGALFNSYGDVLEVASFRALNNGGDDITITNSLDTDIYTITYTSSTSGKTTELVNPNGPDYSLNNYGTSTDTEGGTPGEENSIFDDTPDTTSPTISSISVISSTALDVIFSESVQESTATVAGNYTIDGSITVSSAERDSDNNSLVHLVVSELVSGDTRVLTVNNVSDLSGNAVS